MIHKKIATRIMLALSLGVVWNAAGATDSDSTDDHTVIITEHDYWDGRIDGPYENGSTVIIKGGKGDEVQGGYDTHGYSANDNTVIIDGKDSHYSLITGGRSISQEAYRNVVDFKSGNVSDEIIGGEGSHYGNENKVIIREDGKTGYGIAVFGGDSRIHSDKNEVIIYGNQIYDDVVGGSVEVWDDTYVPQTSAINNTVSINGPITVNGDIMGGIIMNDRSGKIFKDIPFERLKQGNILNINTFGVTAGNIYNFENINFNLPKQLEDKAMLTLTKNEATDLTGSKIVAHVAGDTNVTGPTKIVLLDKKQGELIMKDATTRNQLTVTQGVSRVTSLKMQTEDNDIVLYINGKPATDTTDPATKPDETTKPDKPATDTTDPETKSDETTKPDTPSNNTDSVFHHGDPLMEQTKSLVETAVAMASFTNKGADSVAETMASSVKAAIAKNNGNDSPFFNSTMFALKYKTGSHIKTYGSTTQIGFGMQREKANGTVTFAPFMEYGIGKYSSLVDSGVRGDGDIHNFGGGMLVRYDTNTGAYYEGALRVGRISGDYRGVFTVGGPQAVSFDSDATYVTAHAGVGYVKPLSDTTTLDTYGTYFYSHTGGDTVRLSTGETHDFDAVDSHRLRVGTRYTKDFSNYQSIYAGLGVEHEFDGEAIAYYDGASTPSPRLKGTSGLIELGWSHNVGKARSTYQQIGVTGWFGRERGITAHANFGWVF
ncbi:autotransporter outer membrane beta-barrel domain-containing protein [Veillonella magna]|uniref:autotransporter outer membrane beta-barrel domain-containing protein n=1 Tax=Veillonella magna TaxID=464322 RepID=UPI002665B81F|nr:autotransporter outer membrane beta-barrel domain-containing protein [Veillonella magna]